MADEERVHEEADRLTQPDWLKDVDSDRRPAVPGGPAGRRTSPREKSNLGTRDHSALASLLSALAHFRLRYRSGVSGRDFLWLLTTHSATSGGGGGACSTRSSPTSSTVRSARVRAQ